MRSLREYQRELQGAILAENVPALQETFPVERLAIYRHAYRARLAGALRVNYPVLSQHLGETEFERVAGDYTRAQPSRHFSIRWHGTDLVRVLPTDPLKELARMEWALGTAFDAADAAPFDLQALASMPVDDWAMLHLALHPSMNLLSMEWAIEPLWESIRAGDVTIASPEAHRHTLLVWRKQLQAHWRIATLDEGRALRALGTHGTLEAACEAVGAESAAAVGEWFAGWVREEMLVAGART